MDNSVPPSGSGSQATPGAASVSAVPVSIPNAEAFVRLVHDYANIEQSVFLARYPEFDTARRSRQITYKLSRENATMDTFIWIAEQLLARIDARSSETACGLDGAATKAGIAPNISGIANHRERV